MFNKTRNPIYKQVFLAVPKDSNTTIDVVVKKTGAKVSTVKFYLNLFYDLGLIELTERDLLHNDEMRFKRIADNLPAGFNGTRKSVGLPAKRNKKTKGGSSNINKYGEGFVEVQAGRYTRSQLVNMIEAIDAANNLAKGFVVGMGDLNG